MIGEQPARKKPVKPAASAPPPAEAPKRPRARVSLQRKADSTRDCVYCKETIGEQGHAWCLRCKTVVHKDCADELSGCPSLGCGGELMRYTPKALAPPVSKPPPVLPALGAAAFFGVTALAILAMALVVADLMSPAPAVLGAVAALYMIRLQTAESFRDSWNALRLNGPYPRLRALGLKGLRLGVVMAGLGFRLLKLVLIALAILAIIQGIQSQLGPQASPFEQLSSR